MIHNYQVFSNIARTLEYRVEALLGTKQDTQSRLVFVFIFSVEWSCGSVGDRARQGMWT